jgi:hypothetical protein
LPTPSWLLLIRSVVVVVVLGMEPRPSCMLGKHAGRYTLSP